MENYIKFSAEELRGFLLADNLIHEHMTEEDYTALLDHEAELDEPSEKVIDFCHVGLSAMPKYEDTGKRGFDINDLFNQAEIKSVPRKNPKLYIKKRTVILIAAIILLLIFAGCAAFIDFFREILNLPEKEPIELKGDIIIWTSSERFYNSMNEMLEAENLKILYPVELPDDYIFTNFETIDFGTAIEIRAYSLEPYIFYRVRIKSDLIVEDYEYELNGIKYNIFELDNKLQIASWNYGADYYQISVYDRTILFDIIENLREK